MNLRTTILRGALSVFALALFASVQAQTITFEADFYASETDLAIVTFNGDTIFQITPDDGLLVFPAGSFSTSPFNVATYGAGDYTVTLSDNYGDGGASFSVDGGDLNCTGECSGTVANCGGFGNYCLQTWAFSLISDVPGCDDATALNYDELATLNDGSCLYDQCPDSTITMVFLEMTDTYGDGWNGNTYTLFLDGQEIATGTLDESVTGTGGFFGGPAFGQDTLCLSDGCYSINVGGGSLASTTGVSIISAYDGSTLFSYIGGGAADFYLGDAPEVCGCTDAAAVNYDPSATIDNGSCVGPEYCGENTIFVQFVMEDSFGDGWDGTSYTLYDSNGDAVQSGSLDNALVTVDDGGEGYDYFCLATDECWTLEVGGGNYLGEKGWSIIDPATQTTLYEAPFGAASGTFGVNGEANCGCTDETAFNYDPSVGIDDGSCFTASCAGSADSTSYLLYLTAENNIVWGFNDAVVYDIVTGDTLLVAGYNGIEGPDFSPTPVEGYWDLCVPNDACLALSAGGGSTFVSATWSILDFSGNTTLHEGELGVYDIGFGASASNCESGCTNQFAINYSESATIDDGSCVLCDNGSLGIVITLQDDFAGNWGPNNYYVISEETGDTVLTGTKESGQTTVSLINCLPIGCYSFSTDGINSFSEGWAISDNLGNEYAPLTYGPADSYPIAFGGTDVTDCGFVGCTDPAANNYNISATEDEGCVYPPANDTPETAQAVACGLTLTGTLENANGDEYSGTFILGNEMSTNGAIWYEFNADQDYQVEFNLCQSQFAENGVTDTDMAVFLQNADGSLTAIATNDDSGISGCGAGSGWNSVVSINAEQGNNYLIRVGTYSDTNPQTGIVIETNCATCDAGFPVNDNICDVVLPLVDGGSYDGSTCCSGSDDAAGLTGLSTLATAYGVWYEIPVDSTANLYNITMSTTGDGAIGYGLYSATACDDLTDIEGGVIEGAEQTSMNGASTFSLPPVEGPVTVGLEPANLDLTYYLYIWTTEPDLCGGFNITLEAEVIGCADPVADNYNENATVNEGCFYTGVVQPNDSCSNAVAIECGQTIAGSTGGATAVGGLNPCGGSSSGVWYDFNNGGMEQLVTVSTCGSLANTGFELFQEVSDPDATLEVNSLNSDNYQNISAVIVFEGDTVASIPAGELFPTVFNDFYYSLDGGDYTVYFTNNGTELDGIAAQVITSEGTAQDLLCSGGCSTAPTVCLDLTIISDNYPGETSFDLVDANGNVAWAGGIEFGTNNLSACVPPGDYTFTMYDVFSDGICCNYGFGSYSLSGPDGILASGGEYGASESTSITLEASPFNLPAGATYEQSFTILGGTGTCSSLLCFDEGNNTVVSSESCDNGETLQFVSDSEAMNYSILVSGASGLGGPFDLSISCEPVVYGCQDPLACNYNADANVDDVDNPCDFISCLDCETETWSYCYDSNESWSFTLNNTNGGGTIVIDLAGTAIEQGYDELVIEDAATGATLYNSDEDADDSIVIGTDSVTVSFTSDGSVSCAGGSSFFISMAITCAPAPSTGCSDDTACNYNGPVDFADDATCDYGCLGCTEIGATNYNPFATVNDGSCCYGEPVELVINGSTSTFFPWEVSYAFLNAAGDTVLSGMTDNTAGGTQLIDVCLDEPGCYDFVVAGGSGFFGWTMDDALNTSSGSTGTFQVGIGIGCVEGCDIPFAMNYQSPDSIDIVNNDLCDFTNYVMGCTYVDAENYDELATNDDGSCTFNVANPCPTDLNGDGQTTTSDLLIFLGAFGTDCE